MNGIKTQSVNHAYGDRNILHDVTFNAPSGGITYLAGENGAGKTTWIKLACGLLPLRKGEIRFSGHPFAGIRSLFGIAFDTPPTYPKLSGHDNLKILYDVDARMPENRAFFESVGFSHPLLAKRTGQYSMGQRHRFGIAAALARRPQFLLLDEPDIGLDPASWEQVAASLLEARARGAAIVLTGQAFHLYEPLVDHVAVLAGGSICFEGNVHRLNQSVFGENSGQTGLKDAVAELQKRFRSGREAAR